MTDMTTSDTPMTDEAVAIAAATVGEKKQDFIWVTADFARTLEKELSAALGRIAGMERELEALKILNDGHQNLATKYRLESEQKDALLQQAIPLSDEMDERLFELCGTAWLSGSFKEDAIEALLNIAIPIQQEKQNDMFAQPRG